MWANCLCLEHAAACAAVVRSRWLCTPKFLCLPLLSSRHPPPICVSLPTEVSDSTTYGACLVLPTSRPCRASTFSGDGQLAPGCQHSTGNSGKSLLTSSSAPLLCMVALPRPPLQPPPPHTHAMHMRTQHAPQSPVAVNAQRVFIEAQTKPCSRAIEAGTEVADEASTEVINEANIEVTSEANSEVKNEACKRSEPTCRNEAITKCRISTKRSQDRMTQRRCNRSEKRSKKRSSQHVSKRR